MRDSSPAPRGQLRYLSIAASLLFAGLMLYAQTNAFSWDEGFHLLAAQLILAGKRPYLDFCFPQTPLNAYLTAGWMRLFGDTWRAVHVLEVFWVAGAAFRTAGFVRSRFPVPGWRLAGALAALAAVGMNSQVVLFGTIGQSYGLCLFLIVAAYRLAVVAVEYQGAWRAAAAGFLAGAAAASSLLTAPVAPVILVWIALRNRAGNRWGKLAAYLGGGAIAFLPIAWLYRQGPQQVLFNLVQYQLRYRHVNWNGATSQDITTLTSWIDSAQGLSLILLAGAGIWFIERQSNWQRQQRAEFFLSLWLALALTVELAIAHPTFERYFLLAVPFVAIPAIAGLYAVGTRLAGADRPGSGAILFIVILTLGLGKALYEDSDSYSWRDTEEIARKVDQVTPPGASLWADELIYFLLRRPPPDGMEFAYAHSIDMPAGEAVSLHVLTQTELRRRATAGAYQTVAACYDTDNTDAVKVADLYRDKDTIKDCTIYWDWAGH
jgi:hypothetical protein